MDTINSPQFPDLDKIRIMDFYNIRYAYLTKKWICDMIYYDLDSRSLIDLKRFDRIVDNDANKKYLTYMLNNPIFQKGNLYEAVEISYFPDKKDLTFINPNLVYVMKEMYDPCSSVDSLLFCINIYYKVSILVIEFTDDGRYLFIK